MQYYDHTQTPPKCITLPYRRGEVAFSADTDPEILGSCGIYPDGGRIDTEPGYVAVGWTRAVQGGKSVCIPSAVTTVAESERQRQDAKPPHLKAAENYALSALTDAGLPAGAAMEQMVAKMEALFAQNSVTALRQACRLLAGVVAVRERGGSYSDLPTVPHT